MARKKRQILMQLAELGVIKTILYPTSDGTFSRYFDLASTYEFLHTLAKEVRILSRATFSEEQFEVCFEDAAALAQASGKNCGMLLKAVSEGRLKSRTDKHAYLVSSLYFRNHEFLDS